MGPGKSAGVRGRGPGGCGGERAGSLAIPRLTVGLKLFPARKQRLSVKAGGQVHVG